MLLVIPFTESEIPRVLDNLRWCEHLDGLQNQFTLLAFEGNADIQSIEEQAKRCFSTIKVFRYDKWRGDVKWPVPQNYAWQTVARYIESIRIDYNSWFWWESDAIPLKPGWLKALDEAQKSGNRPFTGAVTWQGGHHYVAGVAIYPSNISRHLPSALLTQNHPWDKVAALKDGMLLKTHDIKDLIFHTPDVNNTPFYSKADLDQIPESAVIYHKNKDGSLLSVLEGRTPEASTLLSRELPSFTEQTEWESGIFTFPASNNLPTVYYNPSILEVNGKRWLFTRRQRFNTDPSVIGSNENDLAIWEIRKNMTLAPTPIIPRPPMRHKHEQWEDPRAYLFSDRQVYVSFATWIHHKQELPIRQSLCRLSKDWRSFEVVNEPVHGGNHREPSKATKHEKNWVWFEYGIRQHFVYSINPHEVVGSPMLEAIKHVDLPWKHGILRGGTPPILVGDEYISFFHSATEWRKPKRRYHMGAYAFKSEPPFPITRITPEPLLSGSVEDFRAFGGPLVIFPNGALKEAGHWLVVFGVNDEGCGWIRIPCGDLNQKMVNV